MFDTEWLMEKMTKVASERGVDTPQAATGTLIGVMIKAMADHFDAQEKRIETLEQRRLMEFEGGHDPGKRYRAGNVVQRSGQIFVALADTKDEFPGASPAWRRIGDIRE